MTKLSILSILLFSGAAQADVILDNRPRPTNPGCEYRTHYVVKAQGCGTPICFAEVQCGATITAGACEAVNSQCPSSAQACLDDPKVQFVTGLPSGAKTSTGSSVGGSIIGR